MEDIVDFYVGTADWKVTLRVSYSKGKYLDMELYLP